MFAAVFTTPCCTTPGTVTPIGEPSCTSSKRSTISATQSHTASGVDFSGVSILKRSWANSPFSRSTGAPLIPLPPMSMPRGLAVLMLHLPG